MPQIENIVLKKAQVTRPVTSLIEQQDSRLTPFLPSNKLPGPFRPIVSSRNYTHIYANQNDDVNHIQYATENAAIEEAVAFTQSPYLLPKVKIRQLTVYKIAHSHICSEKTTETSPRKCTTQI